MKIRSFPFFLPFLMLNLQMAAATVSDLVLPEKIFPALDSILNSAVRQSPTMLNRALDLEMAENSRIAARAGLLPTVGASISYTRSRDTQDFVFLNSQSPPTNSSYSITSTPISAYISQPLYHWGALKNAAKVGEIQQAIAKGTYRDGFRLYAQSLRTDYLRLIVLKHSIKRAAFYLEFSKNQVVSEEARLAKKIISEMQIFPVRLRAEQAQIASERAEFDYEMAKASFARLSGTAVMADDSIPDALPVTPYTPASFDQLLAGYLRQKDPPSAEAFTVRKQLEIENLNYATAKTRLRPKATFSTGVTQSVQHNLYGTVDTYKVSSIYATVSVNWSIFDGFYTGAIERNSLARRRQMETDYRVLTERLAQQAQTQVKQLNFAARSMAITDRAVVAAEGSLRAQQEDFTRGVVSEADVSYARLALYDAQISAYSARIDYLGRVGDFLGTVAEDPVLANLSDK